MYKTKIKEFFNKTFFNTEDRQYISIYKKNKINKQFPLITKSKNGYFYSSNNEGFFFEELIDKLSNSETNIYVYENFNTKQIFIGFSNSIESTEIINIKGDYEKIVDKLISILKVYSYKSHIYFLVSNKTSEVYKFLLLYIESFFFFNGQDILKESDVLLKTSNLEYHTKLTSKIKIYVKIYGRISLLTLIWLTPFILFNTYVLNSIETSTKEEKIKLQQLKKDKMKLQKKVLFLNKKLQKTTDILTMEKYNGKK